MCTNTDVTKNHAAFNFDSFVKYFEKKIQSGHPVLPNTINLTGGETTICPDLFEILSYIRNRLPQAKICLLTNGRMLSYASFRKRILNWRNMDFIIPIHAPNASLHDTITRAAGSFKQTWNGISSLLKEKKIDQKVEVRIVLTRLNIKRAHNIIALINKKLSAVDRIVCIFPEIEGQAQDHKNKVGLSYRQAELFLKRAKRFFVNTDRLRLYHFPICSLKPSLWPFAWRTLPQEETTFLKACGKCLAKKYCLGIHKSYFLYKKAPEMRPITNLGKIKIVATENRYHPISRINICKKI